MASNNTAFRYVIAEPWLSQSIALARRLRLQPNVYIIGQHFHESASKAKAALYDEHIVTPSPFDVQGATHLLTGSRATKQQLENAEEYWMGTAQFSVRNLSFYSKIKGQEIAASAGWRIAQTWTCAKELPTTMERFFIKPLHEGTSGLRAACRRDKCLRFLATGNFIAQEIIESPSTLGYGFIARDGDILAESAHQEVASMPTQGGSAVILEAYTFPTFLECCRELIRSVGYTGWGLVEAKQDPRTQELVFLELNAKLWASLEFSMRQDPRFAQILLGFKETHAPAQSMWFVNRTNPNAILRLFQRRKQGIRYTPIIEPHLIRSLIRKNLPRFS